jgi:UDP-N-acetylmuramoylalanine--D-glutamate ligase
MSFPGLAHRMETIGIIGGVRFVNDSKATNVDAARQAMSAYPRFRWIAGGRPKEGGIEPLADLFGSVIKAYLVGEASSQFAATLEGRAPAIEVGAIEAAVAAAWADARACREESVVLFSPACASFDQYSDFEERGDAFRAAVHALAEPQLQEARG